jgi:Rieske Fe-S protein
VAAKHGCRIFENSTVLEVDTNKHVVRTAEGKVTAREIVLATHSPKGFHLVHAEMVVNREYGISTRIARDSFPLGIFWGIGDDRLSVRTLDADDGTFLICVGEEHKTGHHDADRSLKSLEASARAQFDIQDVSFRWSAQNYSAADGLPYIGRDATGCFIATGFETDGLVYGTLAATLITDQLGGSDNEFTPIFRAGRFSPVKGAKGLAEETGSVLKALIKDYITAGKPTALSNLAPGKGEIVEVENESLAAYKDPDGTVFAVSPVCTHMKCKVRWNGVENSWDCPCHGSRFAPDGTVLEGPAIEPLQRKLL